MYSGGIEREHYIEMGYSLNMKPTCVISDTLFQFRFILPLNYDLHFPHT